MIEAPDPTATVSGLRSRWQLVRPYIAPGLAVFVGLVIALVIWLTLTAPLGRALEPAEKPSLVIIDSGGRPIARRGDYKEEPVEIAKLPKYVPAALIA
ncbi:MAG: penicillin-binding protein, partial [Polymorphobacter sp.]